MNKKITGLIMGGLLGVAVLGVAFTPNVSNAAEKNTPPMQSMMMEKGQMDHMDMEKMMNSPEMQKKCFEMMKSPEMQQSMKTMMQTPEMQSMMKDMLAKDSAMRQMMLDLINSIEPNDQTSTPDNTPMTMPAGMDHSMHH